MQRYGWSAPRLVRELASVRAQYGRDVEVKKLALLSQLEAKRVRGRRSLEVLHESLLFLRAYPDSAAVMEAAERGLRAFAGRLAREGRATIDAFDESGVAGSAIHCAYSWPVLRGLTADHPGELAYYDDGDRDRDARLEEVLLHVLPPSELEALADGYLGTREWRKKIGTADPLRTFMGIMERIDGARAAVWSGLELPVRWELGDGDGSRTLARAPSSNHVWMKKQPVRRRANLIREAAKPAFPFEHLSAREGGLWIRTARSAVSARLRELYPFTHANPSDVAVAHLGNTGVELALIGIRPESRLPLRAFYGYLLARNGVPIGYGDTVILFDWAEMNFHVYETFRQTGSAELYAAVVRALTHHFGLRHLFLNRYQFGWHNEDAIRSGAFWFYEKLGFRPRAPELVALWKRERRAIQSDPRHRTSAADLEKLATDHMELSLRRGVPAPALHPTNIGLAVSRWIEREHNGDRAKAQAAAIRKLPPLLRRDHHFALILAQIRDLDAWSKRELDTLAKLIDAKSAQRELEYVEQMRRHARLRDAVVTFSVER